MMSALCEGELQVSGAGGDGRCHGEFGHHPGAQRADRHGIAEGPGTATVLKVEWEAGSGGAFAEDHGEAPVDRWYLHAGPSRRIDKVQPGRNAHAAFRSEAGTLSSSTMAVQSRSIDISSRIASSRAPRSATKRRASWIVSFLVAVPSSRRARSRSSSSTSMTVFMT